MKISGKEVEQLHTAIISAYSYSSLERVLRFSLDVDLRSIALESNFTEVVFQVVTYFERIGLLEELTLALYDNNPKNSHLRKFVKKYIDVTETSHSLPESLRDALENSEWMTNHFSVESAENARLYSSLQSITQGINSALNSSDLYFRRLELRETLNRLDTFTATIPQLGSTDGGWEVVVQQWRTVIGQELLRLEPEAETVTANPYQVGNPLKPTQKELFKGRLHLRDSVVRTLSEQGRPTLLIYGPRRMGKTSFLYQLPALLPGRTVPVLVDLQPPSRTRSNSSFLYHAVNEIHKGLNTYNIHLETPSREAFRNDDPFEEFENWLENQLIPQLERHERNLLLTFDEFEKLGFAVQDGRMSVDIYDELRSLIQHQSYISFLFAGVQTFDALGPNWSSYFINVRAIKVSYLEVEEARELVIRPNPNVVDFNLKYTDEVIDEILGITHRHPLLIQLICSCCVDVANDEGTNRITMVHLRKAIAKSLTEGETLFFRYVWDEVAGQDGRNILKQIAEEQYVLAQNDKQIIQRMIDMNVVSKINEAFQIEIPLVKKWLLERAVGL